MPDSVMLPGRLLSGFPAAAQAQVLPTPIKRLIFGFELLTA
jgi:hypothetical protein